MWHKWPDEKPKEYRKYLITWVNEGERFYDYASWVEVCPFDIGYIPGWDWIKRDTEFHWYEFPLFDGKP